jgi:hypothetical protein
MTHNRIPTEQQSKGKRDGKQKITLILQGISCLLRRRSSGFLFN